MSRMLVPARILIAVVWALAAASPSSAQVAGGDLSGSRSPDLRGVAGAPKAAGKRGKKPATAHKSRTAQTKPAEKPPEMEPWAAVDPTRAGRVDARAATEAPMPGVAHPTASSSSDGPLGVGMKWNSNNDPNYGPMSTSGLMNQYNSNLNGGPDPGTTVEPGVKLQF
jgi:hypothetical protein